MSKYSRSIPWLKYLARYAKLHWFSIPKEKRHLITDKTTFKKECRCGTELLPTLRSSLNRSFRYRSSSLAFFSEVFLDYLCDCWPQLRHDRMFYSFLTGRQDRLETRPIAAASIKKAHLMTYKRWGLRTIYRISERTYLKWSGYSKLEGTYSYSSKARGTKWLVRSISYSVYDEWRHSLLHLLYIIDRCEVQKEKSIS